MNIANIISIAAPTLALGVGIYTLKINTEINRKNRHIRVAMQLTRDFYQDTQFTVDRLEMWDRLKDLRPEEHNYMKLVEFMKDDRNSTLKKREIVALSRTAAFYNSIKGL